MKDKADDSFITNNSAMDTKENMEWEKEAAYLASLPRTTPFCVPDEYFDDLQDRIKQAVFLANLPQGETSGFTVPVNYFEELGAQIEDRITVERLKEVVSEDGFSLPSNYFDQLEVEILRKTSAPAQPKVIKLWHNDLIKYASAACFIILTASGLYLNQQYTAREIRNTEIASEQVLYDIDESVIIEHLQEAQTASTSNTASDAEMENYILNNFSSNDLSNNL